MKRLRHTLLAILTALSFTSLHAQEVKDGLTWYTDINQAYDVSSKTHKPIFGFFTGSDWCGWCHKLEADVFSKDEFKKWAAKNVILLELDFPRRKQLPEALVKQNNSLQQFFKVQGYPTIWLFNMERNASNQFNIYPMGSLGYPQSERGKEVSSFLGTANGILKTKPSKG